MLVSTAAARLGANSTSGFQANGTVEIDDSGRPNWGNFDLLIWGAGLCPESCGKAQRLFPAELV
jgi:hypothetical protein